MKYIYNMTRSPSGIQLLRRLANEGYKIFSIDEVHTVAAQLGIQAAYVSVVLNHLVKDGWLVRLKRGVYAFTSESGIGSAPHEYAIAMALVKPSAISHWTAMHFHHLTQQIPNRVYAIVPTGVSIPRSFSKETYHFIHVKKEHFFGFESVWVDESKIEMTNLERTLLDGLSQPQFCGDFQEVLYAFNEAKDRMRISTLIDYSLQLNASVSKRLGFILERLRISEKKFRPLLELSVKGYRKLDPTGPNSGEYHAKWKIRENL